MRGLGGKDYGGELATSLLCVIESKAKIYRRNEKGEKEKKKRRRERKEEEEEGGGGRGKEEEETWVEIGGGRDKGGCWKKEEPSGS
jgi:hypothetical protein